MIELLQFYWYPLIVSTMLAALLSLWGSQLVTRGQSLSALAISQSSVIGMLLGGPTGAYVAGALTWKLRSAKEGTLLAYFVGTVCLTQLLTKMFPNLDLVATRAFFGGVVTMSGWRLWAAAAVAIHGLAFFLVKWKSLVRESFLIAIGENPLGREIFSFILILTSLQSVGLWFTCGFLFLPTILLKTGSKSIRSHLIGCATIAVTGSILGFLMSLASDRFATVPSQVSITAAIGTILAIWGWLKSNMEFLSKSGRWIRLRFRRSSVQASDLVDHGS